VTDNPGANRKGLRWEGWEDELLMNPPPHLLHGKGRAHAGQLDRKAAADELGRSSAAVHRRCDTLHRGRLTVALGEVV
jgi:hypothetical protein